MQWLTRLIDVVFPPRSDEEIVRDVSADILSALLSPTLIETTRPATTALLPFRDKRVRALVHEAKYHENPRAQELLGSVLAEYVADIGSETFGNVVLVPLPLSAARVRERGFNQCERVAHASQKTGLALIPVSTDILIRTKNTEHQVGLSREARIQNVRGAFHANAPIDSASSYIILDDVITTGATMQAAIDALAAAGARHTIPLALSR